MSIALRQVSALLSVLQADLASEAALREVISAVRSYTRSRGVFLTEVNETGRVVFLVASDCGSAEGRVDPFPLENSLSEAILSGKIPVAVGDVDANDRVREIPICRELGIKSFVGVPVHLSNGEIFGTLCCFDEEPRPDLEQGGTDLMRLAADLMGRLLTRLRQDDEASSRFRKRLDETIATGAIRFARQPIVEVATGRIAGMEYLARFPLFSGIPIKMVFEQAGIVAADRDFEAEVLRRLSKGISAQSRDCRSFINVSPQFIATGRCIEIFGPLLDRVVMEVLEEQLQAVEGDIRAGLVDGDVASSLAVDDFGIGYSNIARVLAVEPEFVKVDRSLISDIDRDPVRRALMSAVVRFSEVTGVQVIAEGVERPEEAAALSRVGVRLAQGFHFARPALCDW